MKHLKVLRKVGYNNLGTFVISCASELPVGGY
jgi:hypothetical protein